MSSIKIIASTFEKVVSADIKPKEIVVQTGLFKIVNYKSGDIDILEIATPESIKKIGIDNVSNIAAIDAKNIVFVAKFNDGNSLIGEAASKDFQALQGTLIQNKLTPSAKKEDEPTKTQMLLSGIVLIAIVFFAIKACSGDGDKEVKNTENVENKALPAEPIKPKEIDPKDKIGEHAVEVMKKDFYPKAFKKFGDKYMARVNQLAPEAALTIARLPRCDQVTAVTFSQQSTKKMIAFVVDCSNQERYFLTEQQIKEPLNIRSHKQKIEAIDGFDFAQQCGELVKKTLKFPSSFDLSWSYELTQYTTGDPVVDIEFTAKNSFGAELPQKAQCDLVNGILTLQSVSNR